MCRDVTRRRGAVQEVNRRAQMNGGLGQQLLIRRAARAGHVYPLLLSLTLR